MSKSWFRFENKAVSDTTDIYIYDEISAWGVSANDFIKNLSGVNSGTINLYVNSPGGDVFDGFTIYEALKRHSAKVNVKIDGLAASIASIIAMAGDEIRMAKNSFMMIHNAWCLTMGTSKDFAKMSDTLSKIDGQILATYQGKTGAKADDITAMMDAETWMNADEALASGFCDAIGDPAEVKAHFDLSKFRNTPQAVAAMNIVNDQPTERDIEQSLRDLGFSRKQALTAMALRKPDQRDSDADLFTAFANATDEYKTIAVIKGASL